MLRLTETQIVNQIIEYLDLLRIPHWHNKEGGFYRKNKDGSTSYINLSTPGRSDLMILNKGIFSAIEAKTQKDYDYVIKHYDAIKIGVHKKGSKKEHLQKQIFFLEMARRGGGLALFCCSLDQLIAFLKVNNIA